MRRKKSDPYLKVVEWSKEDGCYVGTAPGLILGGVHGKNETKVFQELVQVCEEAIRLLEKEGKPLPEATANQKYSGKILLRIPGDLHKKISIRAMREGESINRFIQRRLETKS
jgi:predicted HicB family RNase H-like nuclease